ncbi:hypothetical protein ACTXT7_006955 [Hymenolepis weldensis]
MGEFGLAIQQLGDGVWSSGKQLNTSLHDNQLLLHSDGPYNRQHVQTRRYAKKD